MKSIETNTLLPGNSMLRAEPEPLPLTLRSRGHTLTTTPHCRLNFNVILILDKNHKFCYNKIHRYVYTQITEHENDTKVKNIHDYYYSCIIKSDKGHRKKKRQVHKQLLLTTI